MEQIIAFTLIGGVVIFCLYYFFFRVYFRGEKEVRKEETKNIPELVTEKRGYLFFTLEKNKKEEKEKRKNGTIYFSIIAEKDPEKAKEILLEINPKCFDFEELLNGKRSALVCRILLEYFGDKLTCTDLLRFEEMTEDLIGIHENNSEIKELSILRRLERFPESFKTKELFGIFRSFGFFPGFKPDEKMKELARKALLSFPKEKFEFKDLWDYELARSKGMGRKEEIAREIILRYFVNAENLETMFSEWYKPYYNAEHEAEKYLLNVFFEALLLEAKPDDCKGLFKILDSCGFYKFNEGILMRLMEKRGEDFNLWTLLNLSERESTRVFKKKIYEIALSLPKKDVKYQVIDTFIKSFHPDKELIEKLLEKYFPGIEESKNMTGKEFANKYELKKCEALV